MDHYFHLVFDKNQKSYLSFYIESTIHMSIILSYEVCNMRIVWLMNRMLIFLYIRLEPKVNNVTSKCIQWSHNAFNADWIRETYIIGLQRKWFFYPGPSKGVWGLTPGCIPYTWNAIRGKSPYTIDWTWIKNSFYM